MIDPDMQKYAAAELASDERVLWAEKTDQEKRNAWITKEIKSDKIWAPIFFLGGFFFLSIGTSIYNNGVSDVPIVVSILAILPATLLGITSFLVSFIAVKSYFGKAKYDSYKPFGGYVLTDKRLLIFGLNFSLLLSLNADEIKKIKPYKYFEKLFKWRTKFLILSPVGRGVLKFAELHYLHDFKTAEQDINAAIKEQPHE